MSHSIPISLALILGLSLPGAALPASPGAAATLAPVEAATKVEQGGELVVALLDLDLEFDPHHSIYSAEAQIFTATYEGLFSYDPASLAPVKAAISSFTLSKDGLVYTFTIRPEASWSDGSPLLARDFREAWLRALDPAEKADYASFFDPIAGAKDFRTGKNKKASSVGIAVKGDKILEVKLAAPAAYFTRLLCHHSFSPIHPSLLKEKDWGKRLPFPVNGPYLPLSYSKGELLLEKNPRYWDADSVAIPRLRIVLSDDEADVTRRFDNGEIHWLAGPMDLEALLDRQAIQITPMFGTNYWFFDSGRPPFDKAELRRALALLLPWPEIRSKDQYLSPAETLVLPLEGYEAAKGISAPDAAEAERLLEKAGFPKGAGLPTITILLPEGGDDAARIAGIMKAAWEQLPGLRVAISTVPSASYFDIARAGPAASGYTLALTTWIGDFADPLAFLQMWESDSNLNDGRFSDSEFDRLLKDSARLEGEKRLAALAEAETLLLQSAACLPIYHSLAVNVVDPEFVLGWHSNALDIHPFKLLSFGQPRIRSNVAILAPSQK